MFTVSCAAIPSSNFPIQAACIDDLGHWRPQKFHHTILCITPARNSFKNLIVFWYYEIEAQHTLS